MKKIFLIHGITKTPKEFELIAKELKDFEVYLPLLPGHGSCPLTKETCFQHFWQTSPEDWLSSVEKEFRTFKTHEVWVGGISLGANLSIWLASKYKVEGLILIGTPIFLTPILLLGHYSTRLALFFLSRFYKSMTTRKGYYHQFPLERLLLLKDFVDRTKTKLPQVEVPTLIMHSKKDDVARPASALYIFKKIKTKDKRLVWLPFEHGIDPNSKPQAKLIANLIKEFVEIHSK